MDWGGCGNQPSPSTHNALSLVDVTAPVHNVLPPVAVPAPRRNPLSVLIPLPSGCWLSGIPFSAAPSRTPSSVNFRYMAITYGPACNPAGIFEVRINLWTEYAGNHWVWTSMNEVRIPVADGWTIPGGVVTDSCTHLPPIKAEINYIVGTTKTTFWTPTTVCS